MEANWGDLPIAWLIAAAQNNNEAAQVHLGAKLAEGAPLDLPEETAITCLLTAAQQDNEKAQLLLGTRLAEGESLPISQETATVYFLVAAKQGNVLAQGRIVNKVLGRKCTPELEQEAIPFLLSEAKNGNSAVQAYLGALCAEGKPLPIPSKTANAYLLLAAQQGNENAQVRIVDLVQFGLYTDASWKDLPVEWLLAAAKQGNKEAKAVLEQAFKEKTWEKKSLEERFHALLPYAEAGIAEAQRQLANCYWGGWGTPMSRETALEWYRKAAENGDHVAQSMVENYDVWEEDER